MMVSAESDPRRAGTIWTLNLDEPVLPVTPLVSAAFRRSGPDILPALISVMDGVSSAALLQRFDNGRRCYTAWVDDQLAAYGWVSFNDEHIGELNLRVKLLPGEVYIWDCATIPVFRRRHLYSALLSYILEVLRAEGLCRAWIGADFENQPSQQGMARAGFHHVADLVVERVLTMQQVWLEGLPDVPEPIVAEARRAFLNDHHKIRKTITPSSFQS
jgi:GNAT superfamily N-acetyltransferase